MKAGLDSTFGHDIDNAPEERKQCITKGQDSGGRNLYIFPAYSASSKIPTVLQT